MTKIRELRQKMGLNVTRMSWEARIHTSTLSRVELRKQTASARNRELISSFLGIPQEEAFDSEGFAVLAKK